ncbi:tetraspanin-7-like [Anopheles maculipalpis]|uniref:tetraspanin-7-like n=1 Tax=Anopheles maculipalpis TaxID=1496333 RepID=UPI002159454E|nr:tetraspanin-7-like [Anopheles maculipalpis]
MHASRKALNMIKYLILMLTFMCVMIEIIQIVVGAVLHRLFATYTVFIDNDFIRATHFLIAVGIVLVFLSIFGFAGIIFENVIMIFLYAGMFSLVVILEIILASAAFSMYNRVDSMLTRRMTTGIQRFHTDRFMRSSFNHMQTEMNCCGVQSYVDWSNFHPNRDLPNSCCRNFEDGCMPHERGCHSPMSDFIGSRIHMIATGTTIIIVFQIVCIITAIIMGARLSLYKKRLREAGMSTGPVTAPEPIMTEKPKY